MAESSRRRSRTDQTPSRSAVDTRVHTVEAGVYRAAIQVSEADGRRYVDKSWRIR